MSQRLKFNAYPNSYPLLRNGYQLLCIGLHVGVERVAVRITVEFQQVAVSIRSGLVFILETLYLFLKEKS